MTDKITITRKDYWQTPTSRHATDVEAFQSAFTQADDAPGTVIVVTPPTYEFLRKADAPVEPPPAPPAPPPVALPVPPAPPPPGALSAGFSFVVDGATVHFTDLSTGAVKAQWSTGNGGTLNTLGDQSVTYRTAGTYTVRLIVWDASGAKASYSAAVTTAEDAPVAAPPAGQPAASTKAAFNCTVLCNVVTVNDFSVGAVSEVWDWGDGTTSTATGVQTHTYSRTGKYIIKLTCTAADGTTNFSTASCGAIVPLPEVPVPAVSLAGQPVTVTAQLDYVTGASPAELDVTYTLNPGDVVPLIPGNPSGGALVYYADGLCVALANDYAGTDGDVNGHFNVAVGGTVLFDGRLILPAHAGTRPFWLGAPPLKASPDLSTMPKLGTAAKAASWADTYNAGDNGPTGVGNVLLAIGTGGEHPTLGPVPEWDADYLTNPTADNLRVVRGMADAIAPIPFRVRDFKTGKMLDVRQYPRASMLAGQLGVGDNPIGKFTTIWPFSLSQAQSHATNYGALACELWGTDFDREQAAMWGNYVNCLNQNYLYRSKLGSCVFQHNAARGFGRGLTVLLNAARNAPDEFKPLFHAWVKEAAADGAAAWAGLPGMGIMRQGGALAGNVTAYEGGAYAPWMQDILTAAVGQAIQYGHTEFQPILDCFANYTFDRVLKDHEFATSYNANALRADGTWVDDWAEGLQVKAATDPAFAAALAAPEGSPERAKYTGGNPGDFIGYPTSATGYPAMYQAALAVCVRYATNQAKAQAAWSAFQKWQRIDYRQNGKYDVQP